MSLDPDGDDVLNWMLLASTYDGLVTYPKTGGPAGQAIVPDLAVSVPVPSQAGLTYTFTLRDGIRFSNGHVLTPQDVVETFERVLVKRTGEGWGSLPKLVGGSTCKPTRPEKCDLSRGVVADEGAGTVTFHLVRRAPDFLLILATPAFAIVPAGTPIDLGAAPIPATGPYEITDVGQASRERKSAPARYGPLVLERNPMFHEWSSEAQPDGFADRIEVMTGVDPHAQVAMVERGDADIGLDGVRADLIEGLERRASDQLMTSQYPAMGALALNTATYPFNHLDARRAVAYALDRDALNRAWAKTAANAAGGSGSLAERPVVTCQILPPNTPGYAPYCPYTRSAEVVGQWVGPDPSRASELARRSGTRGAEVTIGMSPCLDPTAKVVADTLRDLGYHVHREIDGPLRPEEIPCWFAALSPDADVSAAAWFGGYPSAAVFLVPLLSCVQPDGTPAVKGVVDYTANASNFCEPEIDRRMQRAVDLQLTDAHAAARAFESLEHDLIDLAPLIPYQTGYDTWLVSKRASNVEFHMQLIGPIVSQVWVQ